jgi:hypothetical protein
MESNGTSLSSLAERLRTKTEKDAQEIESLTRQQFDSLSRSLAESSQNALNTTENAIRNSMFGLEKEISSRCRIMSLAFGWKCLQIALLAFSLMLGAGLGGWGLFTLAGNKSLNLKQEIAELSARKEALEKTAATWPLVLRDAPNGRFIIPTPPHTLKDRWTFDNQPAWKLE